MLMSVYMMGEQMQGQPGVKMESKSEINRRKWKIVGLKLLTYDAFFSRFFATEILIQKRRSNA